MNNFTFHAYLIECLTNLHVGSGDNNYGVVDKQIQRDTITNIPIINSSSLKGAIREYFEECVGWTETDVRLIDFFGSDKKEQNNLKQGKLRFFEAKLLSIPVRGTETRSHYHATSDELIEIYNSQSQSFVLNENKITVSGTTTDAITEFGSTKEISGFKSATHTIADNAVKLDNRILNQDVLKHLPIIARNNIENGQSENLWYEEVIPRGSMFYFFMACPNDVTNYDTDFNTNLEKDIVQIGANATVGYGYCKIIKIS
jgi:CRISPR-associated protein Cmr4